MSRSILGKALVGLLGFCAFPALAVTSFSYESEPGDFVGQGGQAKYTVQSGASISFGEQGVRVIMQVASGSDSWMLILTPPKTEQLSPGVYYNVEGSGPTGRAAGLYVSGNGRGCSSVWGSFAIDQVEYDAAGKIKILEGTFDQHCNDITAPAMKGAFKYKAQPLWFKLDSEQGDYIGQGLKRTYTGSTSLFALRKAGGTRYSYTAEGMRDTWTALITPPTGQTLSVGNYITQEFADATHAGLSFFGNGRACGGYVGKLEIIDIEYDGNQDIKALNAKFEQRCGETNPPLKGVIRYYK